MKKNRFFKNAVLLTFINMAVQLIQLYMEIYFSKVLGSEGTGIFQLMLSVFGLISTMGLGGYYIAVTRLSTKYSHEAGFSSAKKAVKKTMLIAFLTALAACIAVFVFGEKICLNWIGDERMVLPLKVMGLTLPLNGIIICLNSYYIYFDRIKTLGIIWIFSQLVNIFFAFKLIEFFSFSLTGKCFAISLSSLISAAAGLLIGLIFFIFPLKRKDEKIIKPKFSEIMTVSAPIALSGTLRSFLNMLQNMLIPWGLVEFGLSENLAMENYGIIKGMAIPVVVFPATLMSSFLTLLIPEISKAYESRDKDKIGRAVVKASSVTVIFSIALTAIYMIFGDTMGLLIYESEKAGKYIKILAPLTTFMFLDDVVDSALKGMNEQMNSLKINIIESAARVFLLFILIPKIGIVGYVFVIFFGNILNFTLSYMRLAKIAPVYLDLKNWIIKPALTAFAVISASKIMFYSMSFSGISLAVTIIASILMYAFVCVKLGCLKGIF